MTSFIKKARVLGCELLVRVKEECNIVDEKKMV